MDSTIAHGGRAIYGAPLGILMLEARFARIPGDMGNAETWPFPVLYRVVAGASPERVVLRGAAGLRDDFIAAARDAGCRGRRGDHHQLRLPRPVPARAGRGGGRSGRHQRAAAGALGAGDCCRRGSGWGWSRCRPARCRRSIWPPPACRPTRRSRAPRAGSSSSACLILGEKEDLDVAAAEADILDAGAELVRRHPDVGAIVLECTNMPPYAAALRRALDRPVFDIYSLVTWLRAGVRPRRFPLPDWR